MYVIELGYIKKKQFNTYSSAFIALKKIVLPLMLRFYFDNAENRQ